jgi:hypothetical protein
MLACAAVIARGVRGGTAADGNEAANRPRRAVK